MSLADVEDKYEVTYVPSKKFIVHMPGMDLEFVRRNKIFVADMSDWIREDYDEDLTFMTVEEREHVLNRKEKMKALDAKEFVRVAGFPSKKEALAMVRDGNVNDMPHEADDIKDYCDIYDVPVASVRGKWTKK